MKKIINSKNAPEPVGPYNHANAGGGLLFISGQIALNPITGDLVLDDIEKETHQVLKNLGAILSEAGLDYSDVLKCSVFVNDMGMYSRINEVYAQYFQEETAPARELVEVRNLPKYVNVEISAIALMKSN
jgi:2-iminobutanoate/2-iminopropanoate deaminase